MINTDVLLAWGAAYKKIMPGEILFKEGTACNFYYQLASGQMRWVNVDESGKEYLQLVILPGQCVGELGLFDNGLFAATAIADKECLLLRLHKQDFQQLLLAHHDIHFQFTELLVKRLRFKFHLLKSLDNHEPEKIILSFINYLQQTGEHLCSVCRKINLTRKQIAEMTCLRVETVIRVMRRLESKQIVRIDKGKVYIGNAASCGKASCISQANEVEGSVFAVS
jgi:CRP/FNR family transcriptional regulator, cyclic AMP receptor protein